MNELLDEIVKIDKEAKKLLDEAIQNSNEIKAKICNKQEEIAISIASETKEKLKNFQQKEEQILIEKTKEIQKKHELAIAEMDKTFEKNCELWAKQIVSKVLS